MEQIFKDFLFNKNILVKDSYEVNDKEERDLLCTALMANYGYNVVSGKEFMDRRIYTFVHDKLDTKPVEPFYRGFPESVKKLCPNELLFDQLLSYYRTYGLNDFSEEQHSVCESPVERIALLKSFKTVNVKILTECEAKNVLKDYISDLCSGTRPVSVEQYNIILKYVNTYGYVRIKSSDIAIKLLIDTRKLSIADNLRLNEFPKIVEQLNYKVYNNKKVKKLNLKNQDRKFLTKVLNGLILKAEDNFVDEAVLCVEKRAVWKGILHHLHYHNEELCKYIYCEEFRSTLAVFESFMRNGDVTGALDLLIDEKGINFALRNINYIVSRAGTDDLKSIKKLLDINIGEVSKTVLMQLILSYTYYDFEKDYKVYSFNKFNLKRVHKQTDYEFFHYKTILNEAQVNFLKNYFTEAFFKRCADVKAGNVFVDERMKNIAFPIDTATSNGGVGSLPSGSKIDLPKDGIIRAFTYWEKVNDIDLSCTLFDKDFNRIKIFNWSSWRDRNYRDGKWDINAITFSGDQTSGYNGGSEYFDIDIDKLKSNYPYGRYLVFNNNVFSNGTFADCYCKAGFMIRDKFNSGEVYEPKTVQTSYLIDAKSSECYLFAIDLIERKMIWLNANIDSSARVTGTVNAKCLLKYFNILNDFNVYNVFSKIGTNINSIEECTSENDIVIVPEITEETAKLKCTVITPQDTEKMLKVVSK